jgi:hypothetical protein
MTYQRTLTGKKKQEKFWSPKDFFSISSQALKIAMLEKQF